MSLSTDTLSSQRVELAGTLEEAMELCHQRGWTDGLPVIPPTEDKVVQFLEAAGLNPSHVIGTEPVRGRVITVEKVAISAVMGGCLPQYMPVILTAVECMLQPEYNLHGTSASTAGAAPLLIVNGPVRSQLGFASGENAFGPGPDRRPNATVGRAIRLLLINALQNHPQGFDRSTLGHPGKYSYCIAEGEEDSPWEPLHVERGFPQGASTVTVFAAMAPVQIHVNRGGTPEAILTCVADHLLGHGPGHGEVIVILTPEQIGFFREAGWSKGQVKEFLYQKARRTSRQWAEAFQGPLPAAGDEDKEVPVCRSPEAVVLLAVGGSAGAWAAVVPCWAKGVNSRSVTRQVPAAGA